MVDIIAAKLSDYLLSSMPSYRQLSLNLQAVQDDFRVIQLFLNWTDI